MYSSRRLKTFNYIMRKMNYGSFRRPFSSLQLKFIFIHLFEFCSYNWIENRYHFPDTYGWRKSRKTEMRKLNWLTLCFCLPCVSYITLQQTMTSRFSLNMFPVYMGSLRARAIPSASTLPSIEIGATDWYFLLLEGELWHSRKRKVWKWGKCVSMLFCFFLLFSQWMICLILLWAHLVSYSLIVVGYGRGKLLVGLVGKFNDFSLYLIEIWIVKSGNLVFRRKRYKPH